jgi:hypothetical protein
MLPYTAADLLVEIPFGQAAAYMVDTPGPAMQWTGRISAQKCTPSSSAAALSVWAQCGDAPQPRKWRNGDVSEWSPVCQDRPESIVLGDAGGAFNYTKLLCPRAAVDISWEYAGVCSDVLVGVLISHGPTRQSTGTAVGPRPAITVQLRVEALGAVDPRSSYLAGTVFRQLLPRDALQLSLSLPGRNPLIQPDFAVLQRSLIDPTASPDNIWLSVCYARLASRPLPNITVFQRSTTSLEPEAVDVWMDLPRGGFLVGEQFAVVAYGEATPARSIASAMELTIAHPTTATSDCSESTVTLLAVATGVTGLTAVIAIGLLCRIRRSRPDEMIPFAAQQH